MTHQEISKLRLLNQQLIAGSIQTAAELVYHFGAVQGQEYEQTKWGLGIRLPHLNNDDIEKEIESGKIYRTHLLRPTWHFVHADDILWMQALTSERVQVINRFMYRQLELTDKILGNAADIICQSLNQAESLTRAELSGILSRHHINTEGFRMGYFMMNAELKGLIANGKRKGKQQTYALLKPSRKITNDERASKASKASKASEAAKTSEAAKASKTSNAVIKIPSPVNFQSNKIDKEEGLLNLAKRYFKSRGPATVKDFSTWSGLTIADCQLGISLNGQSIDKFSFEEEVYYHFPAKTSVLSNFSDLSNVSDIQADANLTGKKNISNAGNTPVNDLFLLPVYDELIMGYKDRKSIMQNFKKGQQYKYNCMIIYQGQIIGTYKRTIKSKSAFFEFDFFKTPDKKQKGLISAALKKFESFSDLKVSVLRG